MTIAQRFVELGEQMGIDTSECKTGNIAEVLNVLTQKMQGVVADSQNIQLAMMNLTNALKDESGEGEPQQSATEPKTPTEPTTEPEENGEETGW